MDSLTLQILLTMKDQASEKLKTVTSYIEDHARAIGRAGMRMAMLGGIVLGVAALALQSANAQAQLAGETAVLQANYQKLAGTVATALLPMIKNLLNTFNGFLDFLNKINPGLSENAIRFIAIGAALLIVVGTLLKFTMMILEINKALKIQAALMFIIKALSGPAGWAQLAVGAGIITGAGLGIGALAGGFGGGGGGSSGGATTINIQGGPLIMTNQADMQKFSRQISAQQRVDTRRTTSRYP